MADYFSLPRPRVFGHRGAAALAPENTLPSFALAQALGAPYLELDVRATRDGAVVVIHDATVDRTTDGSGPVAELSFSRLERLDAGYRFSLDGTSFPYRGQGVRVPRLEQVLRQFPGACLNIEIKQAEPDIVEDVVRLLRAEEAASRTASTKPATSAALIPVGISSPATAHRGAPSRSLLRSPGSIWSRRRTSARPTTPGWKCTYGPSTTPRKWNGCSRSGWTGSCRTSRGWHG